MAGAGSKDISNGGARALGRTTPSRRARGLPVRAPLSFLPQHLNFRGDLAGKILLGVEDVAWLLSLSERSVWVLARAGKIPQPVRFGTRALWVRHELEAWATHGLEGWSRGWALQDDAELEDDK
jgi:predicted DNA-binding transcriptional regulator AlpA